MLFTNEQPPHIFIDYRCRRRLITVRNKLRPRKLTEVTTQTGFKKFDERYRLLSNQPITVNNNGDEFAVSIKIINQTLTMNVVIIEDEKMVADDPAGFAA